MHIQHSTVASKFGQSTLNSHDLVEGKCRRNTFELFNEYNFLFLEALWEVDITSYWLRINTEKKSNRKPSHYLVCRWYVSSGFGRFTYSDYSFSIFDAY